MPDLKRWCQYDPHSNEPVMCLAPKRSRSIRPAAFVIRLSDAYLFTDPMFIRKYAYHVAERLELGLLTVERLTEIRSTIEDGLDELVKMKPCSAVYDDPAKCIGEGTLICDGTSFDFEVTDRILRQ